jgi:N6-adenosine-specific RNA methylase IME4
MIYHGDLPDKKYQIIYADPPWPYRQFSTTKGINPKFGSVLSQYQTMTIEEIKTLGVGNVADKKCVLFMWATMPNLNVAFDVIKAWGFIYKTCAYTWVKLNPLGVGIYSGMGHWTNGNAELCLLATKGEWPKRVVKNSKQIQMWPRGKHSAKPPEIRQEITRFMGNIPRIELFARQETEGWDCWGNELVADTPLLQAVNV